MKKTLIISAFFATAFCISSPAGLKNYDKIMTIHQILHSVVSPKQPAFIQHQPLPTRATGAQAIAGFGAVIQRIAPLLPPPQAAILEVMSMAVTVVAGCVAADEEQQRYLDFLKWKEQHKSIEPNTAPYSNDLAYAIKAATAVHDELLKPQFEKIIAHFCSQFEDGITTPQSTILFLNPATTTPNSNSSSYKTITIQDFFSELAGIFTQGILILKKASQESSF